MSSDGKVVWSWFAREEFDKPPYNNIHNQGWTHTNAVSRMENGNTLISPRNFNCLIEVDPRGKAVRVIGKEYLEHQHDPEILSNGNILVANHQMPHEAIEIDTSLNHIGSNVLQNRRGHHLVIPSRKVSLAIDSPFQPVGRCRPEKIVFEVLFPCPQKLDRLAQRLGSNNRLNHEVRGSTSPQSATQKGCIDVDFIEAMTLLTTRGVNYISNQPLTMYKETASGPTRHRKRMEGETWESYERNVPHKTQHFWLYAEAPSDVYEQLPELPTADKTEIVDVKKNHRRK